MNARNPKVRLREGTSLRNDLKMLGQLQAAGFGMIHTQYLLG